MARSVPWDDSLEHRAEQHVERIGEAGQRLIAGAYRDLDPAGSDPEGDLLALMDGLEMTSLVGMVDPPRAESKAAVRDAQSAHIRVRMVTGDDVVAGASIAKQLGIPGEAILGAKFAALSEDKRLDRIGSTVSSARVAPGAQGCAGRHAQEEGARRRHGWRWGQRRGRRGNARRRRRHGERDRMAKTPVASSSPTTVRHDRLRDGTGAGSTTNRTSTSVSCSSSW